MKYLILILLFIPLRCTAPSHIEFTIVQGEVIQPYERLFEAVCKVESGNNSYAIGDKHLKHHSYGKAQIRQSRLDDYYNRTGIRYTVEDCFDDEVTREIFMYYVNPDFETTCRTWNGGEKGMQKKSTLKYWNLIKAQL